MIYTFAVIFATWGVVYHYAVWLQKPPTRVYWRPRLASSCAQRGVAAQPAARRCDSPARTSSAQTFIRAALAPALVDAPVPLLGLPARRSAITFPLVFGWIHFGTRPDDQMTYVTYLFGFPVGVVPRSRTVVAWLLFHGLDIAAVLVLAGIALVALAADARPGRAGAADLRAWTSSR